MDNDLFVHTAGKDRPAWAMKMVDTFIKKAKHQGLWKTLDFVVDSYMRKKPEEFNEFIRQQKEVVATRRNKHASFKNKSNRLLVEIPENIYTFVNTMFGQEIQAMGLSKFYKEVARRYPMFKVPEGKI